MQNIPLGPCRLCHSDMLDRGNFYGCSSYRETGCGFTISKKILGKEISRDNVEMLLKYGETRLIEGFQSRNGSGMFKAVLAFDEENHKLIFKTPNPRIFKLPLSLLKPLTVYEPSQADTNIQIGAIVREAKALNLPGRVVDVKHGPRITRFEFLPNKGVNLSSYKRFKANFQAVLKAERLSMAIPIPGTDRIGLEVPNRYPYPVQLRGLLEDEEFQAKKKPLTIPLGMDLFGGIYFADLANMPHVLCAGATGSGKSVFLNAAILSLLYSNNPDELKFLFIDPKQVELSIYEGIPHLFAPIVKDIRKAGQALNKLVTEMERRYELFEQAGVRNIDGYNDMIANEHPSVSKLPYIVAVIDEIADLMMLGSGEIEEAVIRLSQLARAAGIHVIIATQRPSRKSISPLIKANMPVRIAFSVSSSADSMTILDSPGAEELLGKGDMLYLSKEFPKMRLQSGFVSDEETKRVVQYLIEKYK